MKNPFHAQQKYFSPLPRRMATLTAISLASFFTLAGCAQSGNHTNNTNDANNMNNMNNMSNMSTAGQQTTMNQAPVPMKLIRNGHNVDITMATEETNIQIANGTTYHAWTFNGTVPGPVLYLEQGDHVTLFLKNLDPAMSHNIDLHAVQAAPNATFIAVAPGQTKTIHFDVFTPGVFMYHCGQEPMMLHIGNGMYGAVIVTPNGGAIPTYTIVQSEFYKNGDYNTMLSGAPNYVVFNGKAFQYMTTPLHAKVGVPITIAFVNAGPNEDASFHIVGSIFDDAQASGNPENHLYHVQTYEVSPGNGALLTVTFRQAGTYPFLTHVVRDAEKGAEGEFVVTP